VHHRNALTDTGLLPRSRLEEAIRLNRMAVSGFRSFRAFLGCYRDVSRVVGKVIAQSTSVFIAGQSVFPNSVSSYSTFGGN